MARSLRNIVSSLFTAAALTLIPSVFGSGCIDEAIIDDDDTTEETNPYVCIYSLTDGTGLVTTGAADQYGIETAVRFTPVVEYEEGHDASTTGFVGFDFVGELVGAEHVANTYDVDGQEDVYKKIEPMPAFDVEITYEGDSSTDFIDYPVQELAAPGIHVGTMFPVPHVGASSNPDTWDQAYLGAVHSADPENPGDDLVSYEVPANGDMNEFGGVTVVVYGLEYDGVVCKQSTKLNPVFTPDGGDIVE